MIEKDTIRLLRECDAGIKMGVSSIADVYNHVTSQKMKDCLNACKDEHDALDKDLQEQLGRFKDEGKNPNLMLKGMSRIKTNMKLAMENTDAAVADLMTDGCNMGVKSLNKYLNEYKAADEKSKDICKRLINLEERLIHQMREFL